MSGIQQRPADALAVQQAPKTLLFWAVERTSLERKNRKRFRSVLRYAIPQKFYFPKMA
jgi:acyl-ACP thioesterase